METGFDIPVVVFFFNRPDMILQIMDRIAQVKPRRMYLFCDGGRNEAEWELVHACRRAVEARIDWDCEIIRNYADTNRGVYETIGKGACWVFQREEKAIFLEDDNLPELTFFPYCREMLERYENDRRVLWVCGTNYLQKYQPADGSSYVFTKHLLPCGIVGGAAWFIYYFVMKYYPGISMPNFFGALTASVISLQMARRLKAPVTVFFTGGIFCMVPGAGIYQTMYYLLGRELYDGANKLLNTIEISALIAIAIAVHTAFSTVWSKRRKKG